MIDIERMNHAFTKLHVRDPALIHVFTDVDNGDPHDHPWSFTSRILIGGYTERVFQRDGSSLLVHRHQDDEFQIDARHIHLIVALDGPVCITEVTPGPIERTTCFWQFRDEDGIWSRPWHDTEWIPYR